MQLSKPADHPEAKPPKIGVLLVNLGTPDAPDAKSVRRYLKEFLSDRRVINLNPLLWQPILRGPILTFRPKKAAKAYQKIWMDEGSPLLVYTQRQAESLASRLASQKEVIVDFAMTYGNPSIASRLDALRERGCNRVAVLALYPQYSATTTAAVYDRVFDYFKTTRWQPALRTAPAFFERPDYIAALAGSIKTHIQGLNFTPDHVLMSYHGIPKAYLMKGDPYHCQCLKTTRLVAEHLGWDAELITSSFQSRFGPTEWLQPYTDARLAALPAEGAKNLVIASPAFMADCLETLEEISIEGREIFIEAGGENFSAVPCLNDTAPAITLLEAIIKDEISGWR